jgi:hypothetical protein
MMMILIDADEVLQQLRHLERRVLQQVYSTGWEQSDKNMVRRGSDRKRSNHTGRTSKRIARMINLTMFDTEKDLMKLTGLSHDELWENDFDLDDWAVGFVSDVPLTKTKTYEYGEHGEEFDEYEEPVEDAYWLVHRMEEYGVGYRHVEFKGRHYYMVYYA